MRLTDVDALKQTFCAECARTQCENCSIDYHFNHAPTIDAVKHGHWCNTWDTFVKCSECGWFAGGKYNYCPFCGAKMDEVKNDSNK